LNEGGVAFIGSSQKTPKPAGLQAAKRPAHSPRYQAGAWERATVLTYKGKIGIFEEAVKEEDEFTHDGGDGDFGRFAFDAKALVEGAEDGVLKAATSAAM
jgi:hypothetical protein